MVRTADGGQEVIFCVGSAITHTPMFSVVYSCSNHSNQETTRSFYRIPKVAVHKGEKWRKLTEKRLVSHCGKKVIFDSGESHRTEDGIMVVMVHNWY